MTKEYTDTLLAERDRLRRVSGTLEEVTRELLLFVQGSRAYKDGGSYEAALVSKARAAIAAAETAAP